MERVAGPGAILDPYFPRNIPENRCILHAPVRESLMGR